MYLGNGMVELLLKFMIFEKKFRKRNRILIKYFFVWNMYMYILVLENVFKELLSNFVYFVYWYDVII